MAVVCISNPTQHRIAEISEALQAGYKHKDLKTGKLDKKAGSIDPDKVNQE